MTTLYEEKLIEKWDDHFRGFYNGAAIMGIDVGWETHHKFLRKAFQEIAAEARKGEREQILSKLRVFSVKAPEESYA